MSYKTLFKSAIFLAFLFVLPFQSYSQDDAIKAGKTLFRNNCQACHNKNMKDKLTGPPLGGVQDRWESQEDLYSWIRNSQDLISSGHPRATELWNEWKPTIMTSFPALADDEIANILSYVDYVHSGQEAADAAAAAGGDATSTGPKEAPNYTWLYVLLAVILGLLALVLARIRVNLKYGLEIKDGKNPDTPPTIWETMTSKGVLGFILFALLVFGGYKTVTDAVMLGRQMGYQPEQPIKFSHATHAGQQQIDCNFCHDGARRSKHSVIPPASTCMNCHRAVKYGSSYGTAELTKIFASIGFDPNEDKYIENYESLSQDKVEAIYKKWISNQHLANDGSPSKVESVANKQWKGIKKALTNAEVGDDKVQGPINWIRIHNLPDHVYFNHSQHVTVGKLECQTCHGPVEEMDVVEQHAPLSMGWCVNCHRQTKVQFEGNDYYEVYSKYHEEIKNGTRDAVTVEEIGGLECQKCHY